MPDRERTDAGTYTETVTLAAVRDVFDAVRGPVVTSSDVADALDCTTEAARQKLTRLYDRGEVAKRKTGRTVVYWRTGTAGESGREPAVTPSGDRPDHSDVPSDAQPATRAETPGLDDALTGWDPDTKADAKTARAQTRRAAAYLREHAPERFKRGELQAALAEESSLGARFWWERAVHPGLRHLADQGLIEYRAGHHDYQWAGAGED